MTQIWEKHIHDKLKELEDFLLEQYKNQAKQKDKDYALYEKEFRQRFRKAMDSLSLLIEDATLNLKFYRARGDKPSLKADQKLRLLLLSQLAGKSNRMMAYMTRLFSLVTGIDRSYKTIERLYSDPETSTALFNLWVSILSKKEVKEVDVCGDATGFGLFISKHYSSYAKKLKDHAKDSENTKKAFAYKFSLMDLKTKMYVCFGTSLTSEAKAFHKAMEMLKETGIRVRSVRLDKYYSFPCYAKLFPGAKFYVIPRKDSKPAGGTEWLNAMKSFVLDTLNHLEEYFKRNNSESYFGGDKKMFGWNIRQKREDRIDTALFCRDIWHNLFRL
ncbi:ISNCY family transposase [Candidatus Woesearchaeota archaeon]|nr:ISNCY family transposase [Candidatus Woesearchaeota archaeon]